MQRHECCGVNVAPFMLWGAAGPQPRPAPAAPPARGRTPTRKRHGAPWQGCASERRTEDGCDGSGDRCRSSATFTCCVTRTLFWVWTGGHSYTTRLRHDPRAERGQLRGGGTWPRSHKLGRTAVAAHRRIQRARLALPGSAQDACQNWANWSLVITWATVRRVVPHLLPMTADRRTRSRPCRET